jgi:hypothetical protein
MRNALSLAIVIAGLLVLTTYALDVPFDDGLLRIEWSADGQYVTIETRSDIPTDEDRAHVWILTVYGHRFTDGIFAWQIHYSEDIDSVLVLPNDFLTARNFTTEQLGITAELSETGDRLSLRVPLLGTIPNLIVVGDLIEVHALWVQQEPLLSTTLSAPETSAILPSDGDTSVHSDMEIDLPVGGGAAIADSDMGFTSSDLIPNGDHFIQGTPISHQFALQATADGLPRIVLSYTLMRLHTDGPRELTRFAHVPYDFDTGLYSYSIDTTTLKPGSYVLLLNSSDSSLAAQLKLEIIAPDD